MKKEIMQLKAAYQIERGYKFMYLVIMIVTLLYLTSNSFLKDQVNEMTQAFTRNDEDSTSVRSVTKSDFELFLQKAGSL